MSLDTTVSGENAESYISVADAKTYHDNRGNSAWDALSPHDDAPYEQLLRKATQYLDAKYRTMWKGRRALATQALAWPRVHVRDEDGATVDESSIPRMVAWACAEAAYAEMLSPGILFPQLDRRTKLERVGPIEVEYEPGFDPQVRITAVDELLTGLLIFNSSGNVGFLVRA